MCTYAIFSMGNDAVVTDYEQAIAIQQKNHTDIMRELGILVSTISAVQKSVETGVRVFGLVLVTLAFLGVSTWMAFAGKLDENKMFITWVLLLSLFFGEKVTRVLSVFAPQQHAERTTKVLQAIAFAAGLNYVLFWQQ